MFMYLISLKSGKGKFRRGLRLGKLCTRMCWEEVRLSRQGSSVIREKGTYG